MVVTVLPSVPMSMGRNLFQWLVSCVVVGLFVGYVAGRALPIGARYPQVFRFVGTAAFMGYALAGRQMSIWYRHSWLTTIKGTIDGLIYAGLTAGTFGWLWPRWALPQLAWQKQKPGRIPSDKTVQFCESAFIRVDQR